jgi:hypothetical protein
VQVMMTSQRSLLVASLVLVAVAAGCGEDENTLSATEFRSQANEICTVGGDEVHQAFFGVFGEEAPTPEKMEDALATVMSVSRRQLDDIEALAEPSDLTADVDAFIAQGRADTDAAEAMGLGFFENETDSWAKTGELARGLGLDACAGG